MTDSKSGWLEKRPIGKVRKPRQLTRRGGERSINKNAIEDALEKLSKKN